MSDAFLFGSSNSSVLGRFLAAVAASLSAAQAREQLADLAERAPDDEARERDRACALLDRVTVWAAAALEAHPRESVRIPYEVRTGDDAFVLYEAIGASLPHFDASDSRHAVLLAAQRAARAGFDLGPLPAGGLGSGRDPAVPPAVVSEMQARSEVLLDIAASAGECLAAFAAAGLGDAIVEARALADPGLLIRSRDRLEALAFAIDRSATDANDAARRLACDVDTALGDPSSARHGELVLRDAQGLLGVLIYDGRRHARDPAWPLVSPTDDRLRQLAVERNPPHWALNLSDGVALMREFRERALPRVLRISNEERWQPEQDSFTGVLCDLIELTAGLRASGLDD